MDAGGWVQGSKFRVALVITANIRSFFCTTNHGCDGMGLKPGVIARDSLVHYLGKATPAGKDSGKSIKIRADQ